MIKSIYNMKFNGRTEDEVKKGIPANPQYYHKFEPSMTDQSFNYSIASKVEDFIAAGQVIQAIAENKNIYKVSVERSIDSLYQEDLPIQQAKVKAETQRIQEKLEKEDEEKKKKEALEKIFGKNSETGSSRGVKNPS